MQASHPQISGGQSGTVFSPSTSVFLRLYHSTNPLCPSSSTRCSYQKDKRAKTGNHPKSTAFRKSGSTEQNRTSTVLNGLINTALILVDCQRKHSTQHLFRQFLIWRPILLRSTRPPFVSLLSRRTQYGR